MASIAHQMVLMANIHHIGFRGSILYTAGKDIAHQHHSSTLAQNTQSTISPTTTPPSIQIPTSTQPNPLTQTPQKMPSTTPASHTEILYEHLKANFFSGSAEPYKVPLLSAKQYYSLTPSQRDAYHKLQKAFNGVETVPGLAAMQAPEEGKDENPFRKKEK